MFSNSSVSIINESTAPLYVLYILFASHATNRMLYIYIDIGLRLKYVMTVVVRQPLSSLSSTETGWWTSAIGHERDERDTYNQ